MLTEGDWTETYELPREAAPLPSVLRPEPRITIRVSVEDAAALIARRDSVAAIRATKDAIKNVQEACRKGLQDKGRMGL